jgi:hypothetical protein
LAGLAWTILSSALNFIIPRKKCNNFGALWLHDFFCTISIIEHSAPRRLCGILLHGGAMTHVEQHRMILELRDYVHKMTRREEESFAMYLKRDKDDEDLDVVSQKQLQSMYATYVERKKKLP